MHTERHTCLKLEIPNTEEPKGTEPIFVKGTWYDTHFDISITDGLHAWVCHATEEEVMERAAQWDQPISEYLELAERYLGFQQPGSTYGFTDAGDGHKRLSWTFEREGTKLQWRWKCVQSSNSKKTTAEVLDFLMNANIRLSEEVVEKTQYFDMLKLESEKSLAQSERIAGEKTEFESEVYAKFLTVLNSKKSKLRELRDKLSRKGTPEKFSHDEDTEKTESFDEESDDQNTDEEFKKELAGTSKAAAKTKASSRKKNARN